MMPHVVIAKAMLASTTSWNCAACAGLAGGTLVAVTQLAAPGAFTLALSLALLTGIVLSASLRALLPGTFLLIVAFSLGVHWPGVDGLVIAYLLIMAMAAAMACSVDMVSTVNGTARFSQRRTIFAVSVVISGISNSIHSR